MKLKEITLQGFRGFNEARTIPINDRLTLVSAPNSHGKTSVSEGFEWLLYGTTSKVETADSKDEYRGAYRNIHLREPAAPTVSVVLEDAAKSFELQATLSGSDAVLRVNGKVVPEWPFAAELGRAPKPFILQHALKDLLLAAPVERFTRFAALLGFDELTQVHKDLMAFCTKPPLPASARTFMADIDSLLVKVDSEPELAAIVKSIKKGLAQLPTTRSLIERHAQKLVGIKTSNPDLLPALMKKRDEAVAGVFQGSVAVSAFTGEELIGIDEDETALLALVSSGATPLFTRVLVEVAQHKILQEAQFYGLGIDLLQRDKSVCPFCKRSLNEAEADHIHIEHANAVARKQDANALEKSQADLDVLLADLGQRVGDYFKRICSRFKALLEVRDRMEQLRVLLSGENEPHVVAIDEAIKKLDAKRSAFVAVGIELRAAIQNAQAAARQPISDLVALETLGAALARYIAQGRDVRTVLGDRAGALETAQKALNEQLTKAAGTRAIGLLIELLEKEAKIEKRMRMTALIEDLKQLKTSVDKFVTQVMLAAVSGEMADEVMGWYKKIRTVGDPDVHFAGFDMKKTPQGGRVQIKASSYGKDLVSAVSSLSESKLNALGLCISIAVNLKEQSPFEFLIIDDPIQSWDKDHELQFVSVIRELVERGKQIVLLSHNNEWIKQVRTGCADLNGTYYEITGYLESGPPIKILPWVEPKQRLHTIRAIAEDQSEPPRDCRRLQQMRRWSHEERGKEVFAGSAGTSRTDGGGTRRGVPVTMGVGVLGGSQDRL